MRILSNNLQSRFFKDLRDVPDLNNHNIVLNSNPGLDQRIYNLPISSEVAAIWIENNDLVLDPSAHIQVYSHSNISHRIKHYYGCYDPLQYPLLFPQDETGWHRGIKRNCLTKQSCDVSSHDDNSLDPASAKNIPHLLNSEKKGKFLNKFWLAFSKLTYCHYFNSQFSIFLTLIQLLLMGKKAQKM